MNDASINVLKDILTEIEYGSKFSQNNLTHKDFFIYKITNVIDSIENEDLKKQIIESLIDKTIGRK